MLQKDTCLTLLCISIPRGMPFSQFDYSYSSAPQLVFSSNVLGPYYEASSTSPLDPASNPLYLSVYEDALVTPARHPLGSSCRNACVKDHGAYSSYGTDSTCLYSLGKIGEKEESGTTLERDTVYYCSNYRFGQYHSEKYGYGNVDANMRRKNTCRETTSTLKAWLQEHKKNPYPTKGEKIMLAIITKMTLTQVSTWFANARRRLKKENKMTWSPRNKCSEKDCDEEVEDIIKSGPDDNLRHDTDLPQSDLEDFDALESDTSENEPKPGLSTSNVTGSHSRACFGSITKDGHHIKTFYSQQEELTCDTKPKIWSLAQTATSLNRSDYTQCMQKGNGMVTPYMDGHLDSKREDSPVITLRNWVDGMFHDPLFRESNQILNQTPYGLWMSENNFHELTDGLPLFQNTAMM